MNRWDSDGAMGLFVALRGDCCTMARVVKLVDTADLKSDHTRLYPLCCIAASESGPIGRWGFDGLSRFCAGLLTLSPADL